MLHPKNEYRRFSYKFSDVWLQIVALMEGVKLTDEMLRILLNTAGVDIRKNLLQLQMLISSKITFTVYFFTRCIYIKLLTSIYSE